MKYKKITFILVLLCLFVLLFADYRDAYYEIFFGRLPSSRAEALGKGYVTIDNDLDTYFFNPAGITNIDQVQFKFTTSNPYYTLDKGRYYQFGLGYNSIQEFVIGLNVNLMSYGEKYHVIDGNTFNPDKKATPYLLNYVLTLATPLSNDLSIGFNINYFIENYSDDPHSTIFFDTGAIYKYKLHSSYASKEVISFGASIKNFAFSKVKYSSFEEDLPVITKVGMNYSFVPSIENIKLDVLLQTEYQYLLNYEYRDGLHTGLEFKFYDIIALRCGYYYENIDDNDSSANEDVLSELTYGIGVDIPISQFVGYPLRLQIDYANLKQPSYVANYDKWDNFESLTVKLAWLK